MSSDDVLQSGDRVVIARTCSSNGEGSPSSSPQGLSLPLLPRAHLYSLPDIAHDIITSFLTNVDMLRMMETSQWLLEAYGQRTKEVMLDPFSRPNNLVSSLMRRRPSLSTVGVRDQYSVEGLARSMSDGLCNNLESIRLCDPYLTIGPRSLQPLFDVLASGMCPKFQRLCVIPGPRYREEVMAALGEAFKARMTKGLRGLSALEVGGLTHPSAVTSMLSSGACEELQELRMEGCSLDNPANKALTEWLGRTHGSQLVTCYVTRISSNGAAILCSPGAAPKLQSLRISTDDRQVLNLVSRAVEHGIWPELKELKITVAHLCCSLIVPNYMEAIRVGAPDLKRLGILGHGIGKKGAQAVSYALQAWICPQLEELDLSETKLGDAGVKELMGVLLGGAPCSSTLQRLHLRSCGITLEGMKELKTALKDGACPQLRYLDLSENLGEDKADITDPITEAMKAGELTHLREVKLYHPKVEPPSFQRVRVVAGPGDRPRILTSILMKHSHRSSIPGRGSSSSESGGGPSHWGMSSRDGKGSSSRGMRQKWDFEGGKRSNP